MKFVVPEEFFNDAYYQKLKSNAKLMYAYIKGKQQENNGEKVDISIYEFMDRLNISRSTVAETIRYLEIAGLLEVERISGVNSYYSVKDPYLVIKIPKPVSTTESELMETLKQLIKKLAA